MPDSTKMDTRVKEGAGTISLSARSALERLATPEVVSVMEEMLRIASEGGNNNNNNNGGGGGSITGPAGLNREELLNKLNASVPDEQLLDILKEQGIR